MSLNWKYKIAIWISVWSVGIFISYSIFNSNEFSIIEEGKLLELKSGIYDDVSQGGNSRIEKTHTENVQFNYQLGSNYEHAFIGVYFQREDFEFLTINGFEQLKMDLSSTNGKQFRLIFERLTKERDVTRPFQFILNLEEGVDEYALNMSSFKTPIWWFENHPQSVKDIDWSGDSIVSFNIESFKIVDSNVVDEVKINGIVLNNDLPLLFWIIASFGFLGVLLFKQKKKPPEIVIPQGKMGEVVYFIRSNLSLRSLSLESLSENFNKTGEAINLIVLEETGLKFKQYLMRERVELAKKLLRETNEKGFEISRLSGFNNSASFNQTFKSVMGKTPNEYRKEVKK